MPFRSRLAARARFAVVFGRPSVEHAEVVALAPHDLLAAGAHRERDVAELDVGVGLAQLVVELEGVPVAAAEAAQGEHAARELRAALQLGEVEEVEAAVRSAMVVLLLDEAGRGVVDAVVDAPPDDGEVRAVDERNVVLVVELPG